MGKRKLVHASELAESEQKEEPESEDGEDSGTEVKPIGEVIKKTGRGKSERKFYEAFELDSARYCLEDSVLITPEEKSQKPYVAIIKEIKQSRDGSIAVTGQWFYRPEEAEKKGGGSWEADDARELFYSFHRDEVPAESVMHKCVVHFIPSNKKSPTRSKHPGFIVRKVYDTVEKKLWNLTDKDYEDSKQKEIDLLVRKTQHALGDLLDVEPENVVPEPEAPTRKTLRKRYPPSLTISKDEIAEEGPPTNKTETPSTSKEGPTPIDSKAMSLLRQGGHLTRNKARDRWLEKILQSIEFLYEPKQEADKNPAEKQDNLFSKEAAVEAICSLEKAAHEIIGDIHKYNLKMRSLDFNLKTYHEVLTRRLLAKELDPATVVTMTPAELKDGMTNAEKSAQEPQQPQMIQIVNVRCGVCNERPVGVKDIINAPHGDRYQLECPKCGHTWYSSRDGISNIQAVAAAAVTPTVGVAPLATAKFEDAQKEIAAHKEQEVEAKETELAKEESQKVQGDAKQDPVKQDKELEAKPHVDEREQEQRTSKEEPQTGKQEPQTGKEEPQIGKDEPGKEEQQHENKPQDVKQDVTAAPGELEKKQRVEAILERVKEETQERDEKRAKLEPVTTEMGEIPEDAEMEVDKTEEKMKIDAMDVDAEKTSLVPEAETVDHAQN